MSKLRWQDMLSLVLGFWVAESQWVFGIADELPMAMWNAVIVGMLIVVLAAIDLDTPAKWEEWAVGSLGLWLVISPWVLGFAASRELTMSSVAAGAVVVALAAWALYAAGGLGHHGGTAH